MTQVLELSGRHILPFRAPFSVPVLNQGLVLIKGRNEVSQAMDANGVGKTSLLHILSWVVFGIDLRGRRGDDVANRFSDETCVGSLTLKDELGRWTIQRSRRPATLEVLGTDWSGEDMAATQTRIESRLGFGYRTFKNAVIFGQGTFERFATADQADQLRMLDELQGIDFRDALKRARDWAAKAKETVSGHASGIDSLTASVQQATEVITGLKAARDSFVKTKNDRIAEVDTAHHLAIIKAKELENELTRLKGLASEVRKVRRQWEAIVEAEDVVERDQQEKLELDTQLAQATALLQNLKQQVARLVKAGKCPTCRQPVSTAAHKHFNQDVTHAEATARDFQQRIETRTRVWREHGQALERAKKGWPLDDLSDAAVDAYEADHDPSEVESVHTEACQARDQLHKDLVAAKRWKWDSQALLEQQETALTRYQDGLRAAQANKQRAERTVAVAEYWIEAFGDKGLRSLLIDAVAPYVNERVAHHLLRLAAGEARTTFSAQTLLKSGRMKERMSVATEWAWGGTGVDDGSGGQDRRRDLAVFAALQDLAESRSARPFPFKAWDEPGDALDTRGKELFAQWVSQEARARGTGLLITHSPELEALVEYDACWTVVLDGKGARIER